MLTIYEDIEEHYSSSNTSRSVALYGLEILVKLEEP